MQKEDITTWLDSRDHDWKEGLALFVAFSNNKHMSRVLMAKTGTVRSVNMLKYELKKIVRASSSLSRQKKRQLVIKTPIVVQPEKPAIHKLRPSPGEQSADPILVALKSKIKAKFVEAASIFYQLHYMKSPDCKLSCLRILDMLDERDQLWHQFDYYTKFGVLPAAADIASQADLKDKLHNLRTYISKHKTNIKKAKTAETREKYQRKMDEMILERDSLEAKLSTNATL